MRIYVNEVQYLSLSKEDWSVAEKCIICKFDILSFISMPFAQEKVHNATFKSFAPGFIQFSQPIPAMLIAY